MTDLTVFKDILFPAEIEEMLTYHYHDLQKPLVTQNGQILYENDTYHPVTVITAEQLPLDPVSARKLAEFYHQTEGGKYQFRLRDMFFNSITDQLLGVGDGSTKNFMMSAYLSHLKRYDIIPIETTLSVTVDGQSVSDYNIVDYQILSFASPPAAGQEIKISCEYDMIARFDYTGLKMTPDMLKGLYYVSFMVRR